MTTQPALVADQPCRPSRCCWTASSSILTPAEWHDVVNPATQEVSGPGAVLDGRGDRRRDCFGKTGLQDLEEHAHRGTCTDHAEVAGVGARPI